MKKTIFVILLIFLVIPFFSQAVPAIEGDVNVIDPGRLEDPTEEAPVNDSEIERYTDSANRIRQIVSSNIMVLPELDMLGIEVVNSLITKISKYSAFVNDYSQDIEGGGEALFKDLMEGYRGTRKFMYFAKKINSLISAQQKAIFLGNAATNLPGWNDHISNYEELNNSLTNSMNKLEGSINVTEILISDTISVVTIERGSYANDINNLTSFRVQLKGIIDEYLVTSKEIENISEDIVDAIANAI